MRPKTKWITSCGSTASLCRPSTKHSSYTCGTAERPFRASGSGTVRLWHCRSGTRIRSASGELRDSVRRPHRRGRLAGNQVAWSGTSERSHLETKSIPDVVKQPDKQASRTMRAYSFQSPDLLPVIPPPRPREASETSWSICHRVGPKPSRSRPSSRPPMPEKSEPIVLSFVTMTSVFHPLNRLGACDGCR